MIDDLLEQCRTALLVGMDFQRVWGTILMVHPDVLAGPLEMTDGDRTWVEVPLMSGDRLAYEEPVGYWLISQIDLVRRANINACSPSQELARARRYEHKAEELRAAAEAMRSEAKDAMLRLASTYEQLAEGVDRVGL
jgi:hypothetical protein